MLRTTSTLFLALFLIGLGLNARAGLPLTPIVPVGVEETALKSLYRGGLEAPGPQGDTILARCQWGEMTEADFFAYLVITGEEDPLLLDTYRNTPPGDERQILRQRLNHVIGNWAALQRLAVEESEKTRTISPMDYLRLRVMTHPVEMIVWVDQFLVPQVRVLPEDITKYYQENPDKVLAPAKATVRYIFLPCETHAPPAAADLDAKPLPMGNKCISAMEKLSDIRDRILNKKIDFAEAARLYSKAPNASEGGLVEFQKGAGFPPEFEEAAFILDPGHTSNFIHGPKGFYYLQGVDQDTQTPLSLEDAKPLIEPHLFFLQLTHRYSYETALLKQDTHIVNHSYGIDELKANNEILNAGAFSLTKAQAWELYPEFVSDDFTIRKHKMASRLNNIAHTEQIVRFNLEHGWSQEPLLLAGRRMAKIVLLAQKGWSREMRSRLNLTHSEVRGYILDHPDIFPIPQRSGEKALPTASIPKTLSGLEGEPPALTSRSLALETALHAGPGSAFKRVTDTRFTLIQIQYVPSIDQGEPHRESEMRRMRGVLASARDAISTKSLEQIVSEWPVRDTVPSSIVPELIKSELLKQANSNMQVGLRSSARGFEGIPEEFQEYIGDVRKTLPHWIASGTRFLPIEETQNTLSLFYVEQPDFRSPVIAESIRYTLYEIVADAIRLETLDQLLQESNPENQVKLLVE